MKKLIFLIGLLFFIGVTTYAISNTPIDQSDPIVCVDQLETVSFSVQADAIQSPPWVFQNMEYSQCIASNSATKEFIVQADPSQGLSAEQFCKRVASVPIRAVNSEPFAIDPILLDALNNNALDALQEYRSIDNSIKPPDIILYTAGFDWDKAPDWLNGLNLVLFLVASVFGGFMLKFKDKAAQLATLITKIAEAFEDNKISNEELKGIVDAAKALISKKE